MTGLRFLTLAPLLEAPLKVSPSHQSQSHSNGEEEADAASANSFPSRRLIIIAAVALVINVANTVAAGFTNLIAVRCPLRVGQEFGSLSGSPQSYVFAPAGVGISVLAIVVSAVGVRRGLVLVVGVQSSVWLAWSLVAVGLNASLSVNFPDFAGPARAVMAVLTGAQALAVVAWIYVSLRWYYATRREASFDFPKTTLWVLSLFCVVLSLCILVAASIVASPWVRRTALSAVHDPEHCSCRAFLFRL